MTRKLLIHLTLIIAALMFGAAVGMAQDANPTVTADEVNGIAKKLYCPVCENIPLDTCGTAACADWRNEIKIQLEDGLTEQQIIDDFVVRFGDRVVGVPQDPTLNAISLVTPWLAIAALLVGGVILTINLRRQKVAPAGGVTVETSAKKKTATQEIPAHPKDKSRFYDMLEQDLKG